MQLGSTHALPPVLYSSALSRSIEDACIYLARHKLPLRAIHACSKKRQSLEIGVFLSILYFKLSGSINKMLLQFKRVTQLGNGFLVNNTDALPWPVIALTETLPRTREKALLALYSISVANPTKLKGSILIG